MGFLDKVRQVVASFRGRDDEVERTAGERPEAGRDAAEVPGVDGSTGPTAEDFAPADPPTGGGGSAPAAAGDPVPGESAPSGSVPTPVPAEEPVRYRTVTVQRGDTLSSLAERHGTDWRQMAGLNGITEPELIYPGQVFKLPPA